MPSNKPLSMLLTASLLISFTVAFAQHAGMGGFYSQQSFLQAQMTSRMMQMGNFYNWGDIYDAKLDFLVTMLDGSKQIVRSKILIDSVSHKNYLEFIDKKLKKSDSNRIKKIYPSQTLTIGRDLNVVINNDDENKPVYIYGIPKDSCWMFKAINGTISGYSYLSEIEGREFTPATLVGIQYNDGPIIPFDKKNLSAMVANDPDALEFIKNKDYYRAIKKYNKDFKRIAIKNNNH